VSSRAVRTSVSARVRGVVRGLAALCLHPVPLSVVLGTLLVTAGLASTLLETDFSGANSSTIRRFLATEYRSEVNAAVLATLSLGALVGLGLGLTGWLLDGLRTSLFGGSPGRPVGPRSRVLVLVLVLWTWSFLDDVASRPALYQDHLYALGGVLAAVECGVADFLGRIGIGALFAAVLTLWFFLPRWRHGRALRLPVRPRSLGLVGVGTLGLAGVMWLSARRAVPHPARGGPPNLLLIAADSLRPDRIDARRAPHLLSLAEGGVSFERATTTLPRTFPAWVSILTGQLPQHHGIRHMFPSWEARQRRFDTVARRLGEQGYLTAVVGDFAADIFRRIELGYASIDTPTFSMRELLIEQLLGKNLPLLPWLRGEGMRELVPAISEMHVATDPDVVTERALSQIDRARGRPFFVTVFYSTPHFPYAASGAMQRRFRVPDYRGPFRYKKADTLRSETALTEPDRQQVRALYDAAVAETDRSIGDLLAGLVHRGLAGQTWVVVTADHGEQLYEHGRGQGHGDHLYGLEALRVPLIVHPPTAAPMPRGRKIPQVVSLLDLAPTLLDLLGQPPLPRADGRSLLPLLQGKSLVERPVYAETGLWFTESLDDVPLDSRIPYPELTALTSVDRRHGDQVVLLPAWEEVTAAAKHRMLEDEQFRLVYRPTRAGPSYLLFDLGTDPACTRDVAAKYPLELARLSQELMARVATDPLVEIRGAYLLPRRRGALGP